MKETESIDKEKKKETFKRLKSPLQSDFDLIFLFFSAIMG